MSDTKNTGGPAFPQDYEHLKVLVQMQEIGDISQKQFLKLSKQLAGMTLRQYAAIHLKVPNSGTDWLDEMIVESNRNELAAKAMQALVQQRCYPHDQNVGQYAYMIADAMLKAREQ